MVIIFSKAIFFMNHYIKIKKSISFIENYIRDVKTILKPFIYKDKKSSIDWLDWIIFLGLIIDKENNIRNKYL